MRRRAIVRLSNQYILDYVGILSRLFDFDIVKGLIYLAICDANIGYIDHFANASQSYGDLDRTAPDDMRRPIRPHKLALSLGLPRETVRRKVNAMAQEGWLVETDQGVFVPTSVLTSPRINATILENTDLVIALYGRLARLGVEGAAGDIGDPAQLPHRAIARTTAGYCLRSLDEIRRLFAGDLLTGLVYCAVVNANTHHLDELPIPSYQDLGDHVPDSVRRPISALGLAARTDLPRETVRRHVRKLEALGALRTVPGGLIAHQDHLRHADIVAATMRNASNLRLLLQELHSIGFPAAAQSQAAQRTLNAP